MIGFNASGSLCHHALSAKWLTVSITDRTTQHATVD
jgi:hypothetical protein